MKLAYLIMAFLGSTVLSLPLNYAVEFSREASTRRCYPLQSSFAAKEFGNYSENAYRTVAVRHGVLAAMLHSFEYE